MLSPVLSKLFALVLQNLFENFLANYILVLKSKAAALMLYLLFEAKFITARDFLTVHKGAFTLRTTS